MCGVLFTWWAGRKNNGAFGSDNQVRGGNVNTRIVRLNPIDSKPNGKAGKKDDVGKENMERVVEPEHEGNLHEVDSGLNALGKDTDTPITR